MYKALGQALRPPPPKPKAIDTAFPPVDMAMLFKPKPLSQQPEVEALARLLWESAHKPLAWITCAEYAEQEDFRCKAVGLLATERLRIEAHLRSNAPKR